MIRWAFRRMIPIQGVPGVRNWPAMALVCRSPGALCQVKSVMFHGSTNDVNDVNGEAPCAIFWRRCLYAGGFCWVQLRLILCSQPDSSCSKSQEMDCDRLYRDMVRGLGNPSFCTQWISIFLGLNKSHQLGILGTDMYLLLNHLKEGSPSTEEDDPSTVILLAAWCAGWRLTACVLCTF